MKLFTTQKSYKRLLYLYISPQLLNGSGTYIYIYIYIYIYYTILGYINNYFYLLVVEH